MSNKSKSVARNAMFGFSTWILPLVISFAATPIIVKSLGHDDYGIYVLVLGFVGYSFNFGIGRAITKYLAEYRETNQSEKISKVISATLTLNLIVGIGGGLIIVALAGFLTDYVFKIPAGSRDKTVNAFLISALIIFMTMMNQVGISVLQGIHRFDVYSKLTNANSLAIIIGNMVLALSGWSLLWLLGWNLAVISLSTIVGIVAAKRLVPEFLLRLDFSSEGIRKILGFSAWIVAYQVFSNVLLLFERGIITRKLGSEALTYYVVAMTIGIYIHTSIASFMVVLFPLASERTGNLPSLERLYQRATKFSCAVVFFACTSIIVKAYPFLSIWMGKEFADGAAGLLVFHTITFGLAAILIVAWQTADGLGRPSHNFFIFLVCFAVSMIGMIYLVNSYGNTGIAIARLAGFGVMACSILITEKRFFGRIMAGFWFKILVVLIPSAGFAALTERLVVSNLENSWYVLALSTLCGGFVFIGMLFLTGYITDDDKSLIRQIVKR